ncbi:Derlin-2 [Rhizoctonia solani]|uniref:Derlin n=1 Tax=Rhizoctonia solani TaxID=456999 RepID=A0A0K6FNW7_9AGAM|nr:Derlin-2 [Rhizoctonia solani]
MDDIRAELRKIPPVTRFMVLSSAAVSLPVMMHILSGYKVVYTPGLVFGKAQIWRIWTSWFLGPSGIPFIFDMLMLYRASNELEEVLFGGHSADYAWHLLVSGAAIMGLNVPLRTLIFFRPLLHLLVYRAARSNPEAQVSLFGLISIKNIYFPFVMLGMDLVSGGPPALIQSLTGVIASHVWFMLLPEPGQLRATPTASSGVRSYGGSSTYTLSGGGRSTSAPSTSAPGWRKYAVAPGWVRWLVGGMHEQGGSETRSWGTAVVPPRAGGSQDSKSGGYNWGSGQRLGSE